MRAILITAFTFVFGAGAQDSVAPVKVVCLHTGPGHVFFKDLYRSPYVYRGVNIQLSASFVRQTQKSVQRCQMSYSRGGVKTFFSNTAPDRQLYLNYVYLRKVSSSTEYNFFLGPQIALTSWYVNYFPEMKTPLYARVQSYLLAASLGVAGQCTYKPNDYSQFVLTAALSLLNYIERPSFMDGSKPQRLGIFNLWSPQVALKYAYRINERLGLIFNYQYQYIQYAKPKELRVLRNNFSFGIAWHIK